jgi:hypothetical protein
MSHNYRHLSVITLLALAVGCSSANNASSGLGSDYGGTDGGTSGSTGDGGTTGTDAGSGSDAGTDGGTTVTALGQITLKAQDFKTQGARSSGFQEVNTLTFELLDATGAVAPGVTVTFTHASLGGSFVGSSASCTAAHPSICTASGTTDATGLVSVALNSGTLAGPLSVTATASLNNTTVTTTASTVAVIGAKASGAHIFVDCSPKSVPALNAPRTCLATYYTGNFTCTAYFADRFGNVLGRSELVTFLSEAGMAGPPVATAAYDPTKTSDQGAALGFATDTFVTAGGSLPWDVGTLANEPSRTFTGDPCGTGATSTRTYNPRDGLVTVIAAARGDEGFIDVNGNGVYDGPGSAALSDPKYAAYLATGEPFIDLGEPYVDTNDNGQYDVGEPFIDVNGNGVYDGPNGKWDSDTVIWAETRVVYTGGPAYGLAVPGALTVTHPATGTAFSLFDFVFTDENLNGLSPSFSTYTVASENAIVKPTLLFAPQSVDALGMTFEQQYCDQPAGVAATKCSNVCPSAPCYVVTRVGGFAAVANPLFQMGYPGVVQLGISQTTGGDVVDVTPKVGNITYPAFLQFGVTVQ